MMIRQRWLPERTGRFALAAAGAIALGIGAPPSWAPANAQGGQTQQQGDMEMTDTQIAAAIDDALFNDAITPSYQIDVSVVDGIANLTGAANSLAGKRRAARLAETVRGVRSVSNRIKVEPLVEVSDSELVENVTEQLLTNPATSSYQIDAETGDGTVTLTGQVESWAERDLADRIAASVIGVKAIDNQIEIDYVEDHSDEEIQRLIDERLYWDTHVDDALIEVSVDEGVVTLDGTVGSAAEKSRATTLAWIDGVQDVKTEPLDVDAWARDERFRAQKYQSRGEDATEDAIKDALIYDPRVIAANVTPKISGSSVTLRGTVGSLDAKRAAESIAQRTVGVSWVTNRLKVRPTDPTTDSEIGSRVAQRLTRDAVVERNEIDVNVIGGVAYLEGLVNTFYEKAMADTIAAQTPGVVDVVNQLEVSDVTAQTYSPYVDTWSIYDLDWYGSEPMHTFRADQEIREDIRGEMWWSPFVDADEVTVAVDEGVATLTGEVDSWSERSAARENAFEGGAVWVVNNIDVDTDDG